MRRNCNLEHAGGPAQLFSVDTFIRNIICNANVISFTIATILDTPIHFARNPRLNEADG